MKKALFVLLISFFFFNSYSQLRLPDKLIISGTVYGYSFDPSVKILNNESSELEGSIAGVTVVSYNGSTKLKSVKSSGNGTFSIELPIESNLKLEFSKDNYVTGSFIIDLSAAPTEIKKSGLIFENIEIAINSFVTEKTNDERPFGKLTYNLHSNALAFEEILYNDKKKIFGDNKDKTPMNLMTKSIKKNLSNNSTISSDVPFPENPNEPYTANTTETVKADGGMQNEGTINGQPQAKKLNTLKRLNLEDLTSTDLVTRQQEIDEARDQLELDRLMAITPEDFAMIQAREELLLAAEKELADAKKFIALQEKELSAQKFKITLLVLLLIVLAISAFFIVRYARQKTILSKELAAKNKKITESIHYALRIQQSVLLSETQVKKLLPESFILYKPLDIVSGDFYWVSEVDSKIILAVADCTGHGVPGAFMSLIGNTLLNQIVNEKKVIDAAKILDLLHSGIVSSLRQSESDENNQDGMDLSLCVIDKNKRSIQFAGAMNPAYIVLNDEVKSLEPSLKAIGGIEHRKKVSNNGFESTTITLEKGMNIYLTTDGFMDQFGGQEQLKFNLPKFKELLLSLKNKPISEQKVAFEKALQDWKGNGKQVDDILLVGFSI